MQLTRSDRCLPVFEEDEEVPKGKNKHVTEGHLTIFCNTFTNFSQSISNNHYFSLWYTGPTITYKLKN